jgi:universal stress protein E
MPVALIASNISMPPFVADMSPALLSGEQERKRDELKRLVSNYRLPAENIHQEPGGVAEVLCRLATKLGADVMTMGAISRSAVKRAFVGSTAESVLERLPCDALVVKAPGFADQLA